MVTTASCGVKRLGSLAEAFVRERVKYFVAFVGDLDELKGASVGLWCPKVVGEKIGGRVYIEHRRSTKLSSRAQTHGYGSNLPTRV
jgi:hypothetical protein